MDYVQNRTSLTVSGTVILTLIYTVWLIEFFPFSVYDGALMWFYGHYLDWRNSGVSVLLSTPIECAFLYAKYVLLANLAAARLFAGHKP